MGELPQAWLDELGELLSIPSVSADPAHSGDVVQAAEWVADKVRRSGGEAELVPYGERPMVVGEIRASNGATDAPTVLCYGHFDVQPPAPLELWESDPFEATVRDEWLYARGVADDKGQLWMLLHAAGLLAADGALPINIRVVSDGEEEVGGQSIVEFLAAGRARRRRLRDLRRRHGVARRCRRSPSRPAASRPSTCASRPASATSTPACTATRR